MERLKVSRRGTILLKSLARLLGVISAVRALEALQRQPPVLSVLDLQIPHDMRQDDNGQDPAASTVGLTSQSIICSRKGRKTEAVCSTSLAIIMHVSPTSEEPHQAAPTIFDKSDLSQRGCSAVNRSPHRESCHLDARPSDLLILPIWTAENADQRDLGNPRPLTMVGAKKNPGRSSDRPWRTPVSDDRQQLGLIS